jgi:virginiamycin B lyase
MKITIGLLLALPTLALAEHVAIAEYATYAGGYGIAGGLDGASWFTEFNRGRIGRITLPGAVTEYEIPTEGSVPEGIANGPDGALWFAEHGSGKIGRITTAGVITEYPTPTPASGPMGIASGPDGALWFTEEQADKIGRITTAGVVAEYALPVRDSLPRCITAGPDGALWFSEGGRPVIGRITTEGAITEYPLPNAFATADGIATGPDLAVWFAISADNKIGRMSTDGNVTEYPLPAGSQPTNITAGDGALWFTEKSGNRIGRITTDGVIDAYPLPSANSSPYGITIGPNGLPWFTEWADRVGQALSVSANLAAAPDSGHYRSNLTFTGSGFIPHETVLIYYKGIGSNVLANATADSSGSFAVTAHAPQSPFGPRVFLAVGQTSRGIAAANFSMSANLALHPNSGTVGSDVTAIGYGFGSLETVNIYWDAPYTLLGTVHTDINGTLSGNASLMFSVPLAAPPGLNHVFGQGETTQAIGPAPFTIQ